MVGFKKYSHKKISKQAETEQKQACKSTSENKVNAKNYGFMKNSFFKET